jgi:hypothetical protein
MTVLLQTRVRPEVAVRLKSAARANGKSTYMVLRELVEDYAGQKTTRGFASQRYPERFKLPSPSRFKPELRGRIRRGHAKHH